MDEILGTVIDVLCLPRWILEILCLRDYMERVVVSFSVYVGCLCCITYFSPFIGLALCASSGSLASGIVVLGSPDPSALKVSGSSLECLSSLFDAAGMS